MVYRLKPYEVDGEKYKMPYFFIRRPVSQITTINFAEKRDQNRGRGSQGGKGITGGEGEHRKGKGITGRGRG